MLNSSLSKRWQRHQQRCSHWAANTQLVGCKGDAASDNELKHSFSQYFIVHPLLLLAQLRHEGTINSVLNPHTKHRHKTPLRSQTSHCTNIMALMILTFFLIDVKWIFHQYLFNNVKNTILPLLSGLLLVFQFCGRQKHQQISQICQRSNQTLASLA